jgi:hypothetical protein
LVSAQTNTQHASGADTRRHSLLGFIILTRLATDVVFRSSNSHYKNRFFESPPLAGFQKTDFNVSSTEALETLKSVL